ncbi:MAG: protoporphyrinogen oxidase [Candidatus Sumerlaeota bacterium]|nr:protoporphyrinogen oxidase [Candidatus Sumerlaeota bacterium]
MSEGPRKSVAVIGAGIAGLATAFELLERSHEAGAPPFDVRVFEAANRPGGNIRTERADGYVCEWGPEGFLDNAPETLDLARRVGLGDRLVGARKEAGRRYIHRAGRLRLVPTNPLAFVFSDILPLLPRLRVFCEPFIPARRDEGDESVFDFAARRIGRGAAASLVDAMASGVYAGDARRLSLPAAFPKMRAMEREHGSLVRAMIARRIEAKRTGEQVGGPAGPAGTLTTFEGGMEAFIEALAGAVGPERIRLGQEVKRIERSGPRWRLRLATGETEEADAVAAATPAPETRRMLEGVSASLAAALGRIRFAGVAVVCAGYRREAVGHPLDGFGFLIPRGEGLKSLGTLWTSSTFPRRAPEGWVLLRTMIGGALLPEALEWPDAELLAVCEREIGPILNIKGAPDWLRVFRFPLGIAQYNLGHLGVLEALRRELCELPGLFLAGTSYEGIAVNSACQAAPEMARKMAGYLRS